MANEHLPNDKKKHVVMFPWLAFGHIIPFFELSKSIAEKGHKVSFISPPRNIDRLPKLPQHLSSSITFVKISLPKTKGLPENAEATMDVQTDDIEHLKRAYDGMEAGLTLFLEKSNADIIIYDFSAHWVPTIAARLGISRFFFCIFNAWFLAFMGTTEALINGLEDRVQPKDFLVPPKWTTFETKAAYKLYEAKWILGAAGNNASGVSDMYRAGKAIEGCNVMIIKHCNEFEPEWLKLLEELHRVKVIPLGLLPPSPQNTSNNTTKDTFGSIRQWLYDQAKGSVLYIALGSEVVLSRDQIEELAYGLELSGIPFFWTLRKPAGSTDKDSVELPDGFEERIQGRGIVWKSWAPQLELLSHDSVGGFLTHCGWSSIVEGLAFGLPLIMLPFMVDQGINARVLDDKKVGVEVPRNELDGRYTRNAVTRSVRMVMVDDEGEKIRQAAKLASAVFGDKQLHDQYVDNFIEYLGKFEEKA